MTTIILNKESVEALFPEGSEARVKLQGEVLALLVKQYVKEPTLTPYLEKLITEAKQAAQDRALLMMGVEKRTYSGVALSSALTEAITVRVRLAFVEEVNKEIAGFDLKAMIESKLDSNLRDVTRQLLDKRLKDARDSLSALQSLTVAAGGSV